MRRDEMHTDAVGVLVTMARVVAVCAGSPDASFYVDNTLLAWATGSLVAACVVDVDVPLIVKDVHRNRVYVLGIVEVDCCGNLLAVLDVCLAMEEANDSL